MNINSVTPQDNYVLQIEADNGQVGLFDVKPYLSSEAFAPLQDKIAFTHIHNGQYFIEWDCGADLSTDTIEAQWLIINPKKLTQTQTDYSAQSHTPQNPL